VFNHSRSDENVEETVKSEVSLKTGKSRWKEMISSGKTQEKAEGLQ
jgi:hypothetical protein